MGFKKIYPSKTVYNASEPSVRALLDRIYTDYDKNLYQVVNGVLESMRNRGLLTDLASMQEYTFNLEKDSYDISEDERDAFYSLVKMIYQKIEERTCIRYGS